MNLVATEIHFVIVRLWQKRVVLWIYSCFELHVLLISIHAILER